MKKNLFFCVDLRKNDLIFVYWNTELLLLNRAQYSFFLKEIQRDKTHLVQLYQ